MTELYEPLDFDPANMEYYLELGRIERARATANMIDGAEGSLSRAVKWLSGLVRGAPERELPLGADRP